MPRTTPQLDPADLPGYRRVPGYGKYSFFNPETGEHRSSRRFYNPRYPVGDPRREITDYQYYRLRRQADIEQRAEARIRSQQRATRERTRRTMQRERADELGTSTSRVSDLELQSRILTYEAQGLPSFDERAVAINRPGGPRAQILEALGLRPPGAPWAVGESDSLEVIPSIGTSPAMRMGQWRSQQGSAA